MVNRFISKTPTDVTYNGGNWLEEFAAAGWVVPLDDHFDWVAGYQDKVLPFAWQDMTFNGKVYGLPYYADTITFMYNAQILEDAGIAAPPQTWEEVTEQSLQLKEAGMEHPFVYEFANTLPNVSEAFASMVFGRGGELIDEEQNPLWTDPESPAAQQLHWLVDAKNEHDILTIMDHETTITKAMNTGQHAFTVMFNYNLAALNNAATSPLAGQFALALMPGETHECYGFAKFYNMTQMAVDRGQEVDRRRRQLHPVLRRRGRRQYPVAKRWAVEQGLGFGQTPAARRSRGASRPSPKWVDVAALARAAGAGAGPAAGDLVRHLERDLPPAPRPGAGRRDHRRRVPAAVRRRLERAQGERRRRNEGARSVDAGLLPVSGCTRDERLRVEGKRRSTAISSRSPAVSEYRSRTQAPRPPQDPAGLGRACSWPRRCCCWSRVFTLYPVGRALYQSTRIESPIFPSRFVGLENYRDVLGGLYFREAAADHAPVRPGHGAAPGRARRPGGAAAQRVVRRQHRCCASACSCPGRCRPTVAGLIWKWIFLDSWGALNAGLYSTGHHRQLHRLADHAGSGPDGGGRRLHLVPAAAGRHLPPGRAAGDPRRALRRRRASTARASFGRFWTITCPASGRCWSSSPSTSC